MRNPVKKILFCNSMTVNTPKRLEIEAFLGVKSSELRWDETGKEVTESEIERWGHL